VPKTPGKPIKRATGFEPEIVILYCQSALAAETDLEPALRGARGFRIRPVALPCMNKIEIGHLFRILEQGADGIEIIGCAAEGCQFLTGNVRIGKQLERARALLGHTRLGGERLWLDLVKNFTAEQVLALSAARAAEMQTTGRNPMRRESKA
jgi:coenzyme F420-reducing hydrogenase delta subunit